MFEPKSHFAKVMLLSFDFVWLSLIFFDWKKKKQKTSTDYFQQQQKKRKQTDSNMNKRKEAKRHLHEVMGTTHVLGFSL